MTRPGGSRAGAPGSAAHGQPARERVLRLFFGLSLPEPAAQELVAAQQKLTRNWRRVEAAQLHLTLAYLPAVPESRVTALRRLGGAVAAETGPLALRLRGTGYHPNVGSPRVWFVKVEGEGLNELAERLRTGLETLGLPAEGKFQPHVTLARKKGAAPRLAHLTFTQGWDAQQLSLIHTFLPRDKTGPIYDTVSRFTLSGQAKLLTTQVPNPAPPRPATAVPHPEEQHG